MPARRSRSKRRTSRRRTRARRSAGFGLSLPLLERRHLELIGLALIAVGVFFGFVLYLGSAGGPLGEGAARGLRDVVGLLAYTVPVLCVVGGGALVLELVASVARPLRFGALCLALGAALALAAGAFGLVHGAGGALWQAASYRQRSGLAGAGLYWLVAHFVQRVGADVLALFLLAAGLLLISGISLSELARATRGGLRAAGRWLNGPPAPPQAGVDSPYGPPEPDEELIVRARGRAGADQLEPEPLAALDPAQEHASLGGAAALGGDDQPPAGELEPLADDDVQADVHEDGTVAALSVTRADLTPRGRLRASVTDSPDFVWRTPDPRLLKRSGADHAKPDVAGQERVATQLVEALGHFGVDAKVVGMVTGPHITRYELRLAPGTKVAKVAQLKDDLAYSLAATDVRILAPIPGKQAVGVEVPNARRRIVHLGDVYQQAPPDWSPLTVWLGKDVSGHAIGADLAKMPHLLVAGTTGAGKSGCINAMLSSVLLRATPHELRLVLVDPKQVELNHYDAIPHLLTPVITSPRMAANALQNLVREMEERYGMMSLARTRSLPELNRHRVERDQPPLPYVLCVIDELADLMMVAPADVEDAIIRLAQKARAVGIHLVLATQSPRVDVITGMIKANVPSRIAFAVSSQTDSRVILDQNGAESLLGQGDMLFAPVGSSRLQRIQGAYIDEPQIATLTDWWRRQGEPEFAEQLLEEVVEEASERDGDDGFDPDEDELLDEAIALVAQMGTASTSMLQRRLRLGYTRAGRLIDMLERRGIISGYEGSKPRQVLITEADVPRVLAQLAGREPDPVAGAVGGASRPQGDAIGGGEDS